MACLEEVTACPFLFSSANLIDAIQNEPVISSYGECIRGGKRDGVVPNFRPVQQFRDCRVVRSATISLH